MQDLFLASDTDIAASPQNQVMMPAMVNLARLGISYDGENYNVFYSRGSGQDVWEAANLSIEGLISEGSHSISGAWDNLIVYDSETGDFVFSILPTPHIILQYNFAMPAGVFREGFAESPGQRIGFLSNVFSSFETLIIAPGAEEIAFIFLSKASGNFYVFLLENQEVLEHLTEFFTEFYESSAPGRHVLRNGELALNSAVYRQAIDVVVENPIGELLLLARVKDFIEFFFPNPAVISESVVNGIYTYRDNFRVVRFYPNNVAEYSSLVDRSAASGNFTSSFLAALHMVERDRNAMESLYSPMNDIIFKSYHHDAASGQWTFYFDYVADNMPLVIGPDFPQGPAIEVRVVNNTVVRYRRLMLNFLYE